MSGNLQYSAKKKKKQEKPPSPAFTLKSTFTFSSDAGSESVPRGKREEDLCQDIKKMRFDLSNISQNIEKLDLLIKEKGDLNESSSSSSCSSMESSFDASFDLKGKSVSCCSISSEISALSIFESKSLGTGFMFTSSNNNKRGEYDEEESFSTWDGDFLSFVLKEIIGNFVDFISPPWLKIQAKQMRRYSISMICFLTFLLLGILWVTSSPSDNNNLYNLYNESQSCVTCTNISSISAVTVTSNNNHVQLLLLNQEALPLLSSEQQHSLEESVSFNIQATPEMWKEYRDPFLSYTNEKKKQKQPLWKRAAKMWTSPGTIRSSSPHVRLIPNIKEEEEDANG